MAAKNAKGIMLTLLAFDPAATPKNRYIYDANIKAFCPVAEMIPTKDVKRYDGSLVIHG